MTMAPMGMVRMAIDPIGVSCYKYPNMLNLPLQTLGVTVVPVLLADAAGACRG